MSKYERSYDILELAIDHSDYDNRRRQRGALKLYRELIKKEDSGIYISKEKATELLEMLGETKNLSHINKGNMYALTEEQMRTIYKALGGDEEWVKS